MTTDISNTKYMCIYTYIHVYMPNSYYERGGMLGLVTTVTMSQALVFL